MYALIVVAHVRENAKESFLQKTVEFALATQKEPGNLRYDILQTENDPLCFVIYEVYRSKDDFLLHRETHHAQTWKTETEFMMAKPRERIRCRSI